LAARTRRQSHRLALHRHHLADASFGPEPNRTACVACACPSSLRAGAIPVPPDGSTAGGPGSTFARVLPWPPVRLRRPAATVAGAAPK
jgi:hypothetical protein